MIGYRSYYNLGTINISSNSTNCCEVIFEENNFKEIQTSDSIRNIWSNILLVAICCNLAWIFLLFLLISFHESRLYYIYYQKSYQNQNHNENDENDNILEDLVGENMIDSRNLKN